MILRGKRRRSLLFGSRAAGYKRKTCHASVSLLLLCFSKTVSYYISWKTGVVQNECLPPFPQAITARTDKHRTSPCRLHPDLEKTTATGSPVK